MPASQTPRFQLPLLAIGQSQKELFHNEALAVLDFLVHPVAQSIEGDPQSLSLVEGLSWLVDNAPVADWEGRAHHIASWTSGGWRFIDPIESMQLFLVSSQETAVYKDGSWQLGGAILAPVGGSIVDVEARQAIDSILNLLSMKAIIAE